MRVTIQASCPMSLAHFPMDTQRCPLGFGSFAYAEEDVLYEWKMPKSGVGGPVSRSKDMQMSQFDLTHFGYYKANQPLTTGLSREEFEFLTCCYDNDVGLTAGVATTRRLFTPGGVGGWLPVTSPMTLHCARSVQLGSSRRERSRRAEYGYY
ncbi:PREDICTED: gamma-aminobutyric acid receptor subunit gamma-4-like [Priapulus caudatus]|uniref:Gamma-aminobutyric acid receptor subunit gamma-4-like n=1 Tax=Priapulus caudatus TaxID=37621 RepID=A0ABM1E791_PRICU|nr:PREDICTED: gamma-aminobutyric acid receptor subunit gamma-4-like [Priapulus caudatus]